MDIACCLALRNEDKGFQYDHVRHVRTLLGTPTECSALPVTKMTY